MRRFLQSFLFIASLTLLNSAFAAPSDPALYFHPSSAWSTGHVKDTNQGLPTQNCFINAGFNNGFFVQISGSSDWVEAIDIDFQQSVFEPQSQHVVNLSVPGLNQKSVKAIATSESMLSLNISDYNGFYKDMRNSAVLDFMLDGNHFRFYMVGLANKAPDFEKCMAGSTVMAKSGRMPEPVVNNPDVLEKPSKQTRENLLSTATGTEIHTTLPTMKLKRRGKRRFSEIIAEEMQRNPDMAAIGTARDVKAVPTTPISEMGQRERRFTDFDENADPNWDEYQPKADGAPSNLLVPESR